MTFPEPFHDSGEKMDQHELALVARRDAPSSSGAPTAASDADTIYAVSDYWNPARAVVRNVKAALYTAGPDGYPPNIICMHADDVRALVRFVEETLK